MFKFYFPWRLICRGSFLLFKCLNYQYWALLYARIENRVNNKTREVLILLSRRSLRRIKLPPRALYFSIFVNEFLNTHVQNIHSTHKKKKKKRKKKNFLEGQTFKLLLEAKEGRETLLLGLGPRYFYHYPGHWLPSCVSITQGVVTWFHPPNWHPPLTRHFTFLIWNFLMKCS